MARPAGKRRRRARRLSQGRRAWAPRPIAVDTFSYKNNYTCLDAFFYVSMKEKGAAAAATFHSIEWKGEG